MIRNADKLEMITSQLAAFERLGEKYQLWDSLEDVKREALMYEKMPPVKRGLDGKIDRDKEKKTREVIDSTCIMVVMLYNRLSAETLGKNGPFVANSFFALMADKATLGELDDTFLTICPPNERGKGLIELMTGGAMVQVGACVRYSLELTV